MTQTLKRLWLFTTLLGALGVALFGPASMASAAPTCNYSAGATLTVDDIQPSSILSGTSVDVVITGTNFTANTVVVLGSAGALNSVNSSTLITATVPATVPAGAYTLTLIDPANGQADCANALTVTAPTHTPAPTGTSAPTHTPAPTNFIRPVLAVDSYGASSAVIEPGQDLDFELTLANWGQLSATNIVLTFVNGDFAPRLTGGQRVINFLDAGQKVKVFQPLTASKGLSGKAIATLDVKADYTDASGKPYSETFTLTFNVKAAGTAATNTPTPTPTLVPRPQLLIQSYSTDIESLQPGQKFSLSFEVRNAGLGLAKGITMILGGGTVSGGSGSGGTPGAGGGGGVSGAGGDLANFAPLGSSNVQSIGDIAPGGSISLQQDFIVNATAEAGAYPMKISFAYTDEGGNGFNDDQSITLLVYAPPLIEISFYRPLDPLFVGQPGALPLQIVNQSRNTVLLGNMTVTSTNADLSNNTILIGNLDAGSSFPLDAVAIPFQPGPIEFTVTVDYVDDFNQPQRITQTLSSEVIDVPTPEPGFPGGPDGGEVPVTEPESLTDMIVRFLAGFLGFDSAPPQPTGGAISVPVEGGNGSVIVGP